MMQTTSVLIHSLCVPCQNRCRYCLLSWNGTIEGASWDRSVSLAKRLIRELNTHRPDLSAKFSFGYAMEHPDLPAALRTLRELNSPSAEFLQCDGMRMRNDAECLVLMQTLKEEGVKELNFTFYGLSDYHDRFAGRTCDFAFLMRMLRAARAVDLPFTTGIPLNCENIGDVDALVDLLQGAGSSRVFLTIPHGEGRGKLLQRIRLDLNAFHTLSPDTQRLLNTGIFRTEREWLSEPEAAESHKRMILISLRRDNIDRYETMDALSVLRETEALDDAYYAAFPDFPTLAAMYGDPNGECFYRIRDLFGYYRMQYQKDHDLSIYDVTDERRSGSRRF